MAKPLELSSLKWPFVGLAALLALATLYAIWDEARARRPWKGYQEEFQQVTERRLRGELSRAEARLASPEAKKELDAARAELAAAEAAVTGSSEQKKAYEALRAAEEKAKQNEAEAKLFLGFEKSEADALFYGVREARHEGSPEEKVLLAKLEAKQKVIAEKSAALARAREAREKATAARVAVERRAGAARARLDALEKPVRELQVKVAAFGGLGGGKGTELQQYWLRSLPNSWGAETVDRCQNCHAAVDKAGYSAPAEVLEAKKAGLAPADMKAQFALDDEVVDAYQAVHDRICEEVALPGAVVPFGGHPRVDPPAPVDPAAATECRPVSTYRAWLALSAAYCASGERALARTGFLLQDAKGAAVPRSARLAPRVQELEGEHAEHEAADDGLAGVARACAPKALVAAFEEAQKANPFGVKPVFRTHPRRFELLTKSHQPERFGCTVCHGGQGAQTKGVMHREFRHGAEDHDWNDPLTDEVRVLGAKQKGAFLQSKCDKCHREELTVNRAPLLTRGKKLFVEVGCWGCHPIEGYSDLPRRGPQLTNLVSKTTPGWIERWISYPRGWRPATRMPNFWPGAVDGAAVPRRGGEDVAEAKARHEKLRASEVAQIAAYLWVTSTPAKLPPLPAKAGSAERGKALFDSVGCRACHVAVKGATARRSEASPDRDYAPNLWNVGDKARPEWIYGWIKNPRAQWSETKDAGPAPQRRGGGRRHRVPLDVEERRDLPDAPAYEAAERARLEALAEGGKKLVNKYGCFGCHLIKGFENAQKIATELTEHGRKDPRLLDFGDVRYFTEEPTHRETYANFVWTKLHTPRIFGYESVETRMPQFDFSDDEAIALLTFLKGQTGERARMPREVLPGLDGPKLAVLTGERFVFWNGCRNCHELEKRGAVVRDLFTEDTQSYAPPIITGEGAKVQPGWLFGFLKGPTPLRPWLRIRMPTFHFADEDATRLVEYFAASSAKSFPYLTVEVPPPPPAKVKETIELFTALQCTKCHVVGKLAPNQDPGSAAPDFLLAKRRLRPDWIPLWLRNPNALMEGTRMPSFWDPDPAAEAPHKAFGGDKAAQMEALRDLLMHLGEPGFELDGPKRRLASAPHRDGRRASNP